MAIVEEEYRQGRRVLPVDVQRMQHRLKGLEIERNNAHQLITQSDLPSVFYTEPMDS